jgi:hypothetical protein
MITMVLVGFAVLLAVAVTVAVLERAEESAWRRVAAARRSIWLDRRNSDGDSGH